MLKVEIESSPRTDHVFESERSARYEKAAYVFMSLLVAYSFVRGIRAAMVRPLWLDELYTLTIAGQPTLRDLWAVWKQGIDAMPPLFFLIERFMLTLPLTKEVALRLPSILAFCGTLICVFAYVRRRSTEFVACVCALSLLSTILFHEYLIQARPYALVMACMAFALVCYQRLPSRNWAVLFVISLVLAALLHYYAVFGMIPFWVAEGVSFLQTRRFRWPVWGGLVGAAIPLLASLRWLLMIQKYLGAHVFARPDLSLVNQYYQDFFLLNDTALAVGAVVAAIVAIVWSSRPWTDAHTENTGPSSARETALMLSLVALPYIVFVLTRLVHGMLLARYVMPTILGVVLGLACALSFANRRAVAIFAVFALCATGVREIRFWRHPEFAPYQPYFSAATRQQLSEMKNLVDNAGHNDLPIVMSDCMLYTQFVYYFDPNWTKRLVYLVDREREYEYSKQDSSSAMMSALHPYFPVRIAEYSQFTGTHGEFLLYAAGLDWYQPAFEHEKFSMESLAKGNGEMFLVRAR